MQTYSLNLLLPEDRKRLGYERLSRFFTLVFSGMAFLLFIGIVLLLPTYFFLYFQNNAIQEHVSRVRQNAESEQSKNITTLIQTTNKKLKRLAMEYPLAASSVTRHFADISHRAPAGLIFNSFAYDNETGIISIRGKSLRRENLLDFIAQLRNDPEFMRVESPVANLLKETDIDFMISLTLIRTPAHP